MIRLHSVIRLAVLTVTAFTLCQDVIFAVKTNNTNSNASIAFSQIANAAPLPFVNSSAYHCAHFHDKLFAVGHSHLFSSDDGFHQNIKKLAPAKKHSLPHELSAAAVVATSNTSVVIFGGLTKHHTPNPHHYTLLTKKSKGHAKEKVHVNEKKSNFDRAYAAAALISSSNQIIAFKGFDHHGDMQNDVRISTDSGVHFTTVIPNITNSLADYGGSAIVLANGHIIYVGGMIASANELLSSNDGGHTFTHYTTGITTKGFSTIVTNLHNWLFIAVQLDSNIYYSRDYTNGLHFIPLQISSLSAINFAGFKGRPCIGIERQAISATNNKTVHEMVFYSGKPRLANGAAIYSPLYAVLLLPHNTTTNSTSSPASVVIPVVPTPAIISSSVVNATSIPITSTQTNQASGTISHGRPITCTDGVCTITNNTIRNTTISNLTQYIQKHTLSSSPTTSSHDRFIIAMIVIIIFFSILLLFILFYLICAHYLRVPSSYPTNDDDLLGTTVPNFHRAATWESEPPSHTDYATPSSSNYRAQKALSIESRQIEQTQPQALSPEHKQTADVLEADPDSDVEERSDLHGADTFTDIPTSDPIVDGVTDTEPPISSHGEGEPEFTEQPPQEIQQNDHGSPIVTATAY